MTDLHQDKIKADTYSPVKDGRSNFEIFLDHTNSKQSEAQALGEIIATDPVAQNEKISLLDIGCGDATLLSRVLKFN